MKIKSTIAGVLISMGVLMLSSQAWSLHCSGEGWHKVSKKCNIPAAVTWQEYNSGVYTQPMASQGFLFLR